MDRDRTELAARALWLLITVPYAIVRRRDIEPWDWMVMAGLAAVIGALALPDSSSHSWRTSPLHTSSNHPTVSGCPDCEPRWIVNPSGPSSRATVKEMPS
jgi:hypothetical protein